MISIIFPVFNNSKSLHELVKRTKQNIEKITNEYEILLIDDLSKDNSWNYICNLSKDKKIKGIKLKKNFGQHKAIYVGLKYSIGNTIIIMDADLQDNPNKILNLYKMYKKNKLSVVVIRARENFKLRLILSDLFWILLTCTSLINFKSNICNFSILSRKVVNLCIDSYDYGSIYPFLVSRKLPIQYVEINRNLRKYETASSYNIKKLVKLTIEHVIKFNIIRRLFFNSERKNNYKIKIQTFINCQKNKNLMGKIQ